MMFPFGEKSEWGTILFGVQEIARPCFAAEQENCAMVHRVCAGVYEFFNEQKAEGGHAAAYRTLTSLKSARGAQIIFGDAAKSRVWAVDSG